ncbi:MAG: efflux RND transporter periplasmic adaptor subunit [Patescibacteria group bacterium]|nr:efflux RND transporter periplasmic adaptor subunit [Patescibacteria group bacterium]
MLQRKTIIWTLLAVAFLGGVVYFSFLRKPKVQYLTEEAKRGDLKETVSVTGTLKANDTISLNFETTGRVSSVDVKVGQKVGRGDVIGYLDDAGLQLAVDQAKANLEKAQADAGANFDAIHSAEVEVDNAEKYLDDTKSLNKKNIAAAEQIVSDTKAYYDDAQEYYNKVKDENGSDSSTTKSAKLTLDTASANWEQAKDALDVADQTADLSETSAENKLNTAEASLDAAESDYVTAAKDATVASYEAAYETALVNLGKAALRAPANGIIKEVNYKVGEVIGATATGAFAKMISYDFIMEAKVPESDIAKMKIGQKATLTFDAFEADERFSATVVSIDPSATVVQDVVDYIVKFSMDKDDSRFKDGMSADLDIAVAEKEDVLTIPERAIKETNGKKQVQILENKKPVDREVKTGMKGDGGMVEITSGLNGGEQVITSTK